MSAMGRGQTLASNVRFGWKADAGMQLGDRVASRRRWRKPTLRLASISTGHRQVRSLPPVYLSYPPQANGNE